MAHQHLLTIADQRAVTPRLRWLTLHAPDLARGTRAGQYLLVRCAEQGSYVDAVVDGNLLLCVHLHGSSMFGMGPVGAGCGRTMEGRRLRQRCRWRGIFGLHRLDVR